MPESIQKEVLTQALVEPAKFLTPLLDQIVRRWASIYLESFGRNAFFPEKRVEKTFKELAEIFVGCLGKESVDLYLENLSEKGEMFCRLGVPFEEVLISLHLFEEVCAEHFLEFYPNRARLPDILVELEELHNEGLTELAISYFRAAKKDMQQMTDALRDENQALRDDLTKTKEFAFLRTSKELSSMQLVIHGINQKLKQRLHQLSHIQKLSDAIDNEPHPPKLLKIISNQLLSNCPAHSRVYFGLFDEERKKVTLYHCESSEPPAECAIADNFFYSELPKDFQDALYDDVKKCGHFQDARSLPKSLAGHLNLPAQREFLMLPVRKFHEVMGFTLIAVPVENFFGKANYKLFQRMGQAISKAVSGAILFQKNRQQNEFALLLNALKKKELETEPVSTVMDMCLGSLIDILGAERSSVMQYDETARELRVCAAKGYKVYPISGSAVKWGEGVAGLALKDAKIISITKLKDQNHNPLSRLARRDEAPEIKLKSLLCIPLIKENKPLGVVNISTINFYKDFDTSEIEMAHHVVNRMAEIVKEFSF